MRSPRQVVIADHLWDALERLAAEMGVDRDALVNQALHALARQHGYLAAGAPAQPDPAASPDGPPPLPGGAREVAAARVLATAARLERELREAEAAPAARRALFVARDGEPDREVTRDRFVIGRGRHCDLVIEGAKVSREHAAIVREGDAWFIEDLGSSNGTWHRGVKVQRRRIADGDEFFVCSERIRCLLR